MGLEMLCAIVAIIIALYYYSTSNYNFWKNQGVKGPPPLPLVGNFLPLMFRKVSMLDFFDDFYNQFKNERLVGLFARRTPVVLLRDLDLIKDVLIKDFSKFPDRGINVHEKMEPLSQSLLGLDANRWRPLRARLSPVFTSGKLKEMFSLIVESSEQLKMCLEQESAKGQPVECRDLMAKYTTDVIGSCAFGLEMNAMSNESSEFRTMGKKIFEPRISQLIRMRLGDMFPKFYNLLGYIWPLTDVTVFFMRSIRETMDYRKKHNIVRNDFVDLLIQIEENPKKLGEDIEITDGLLAAQAFIFFGAGFETSSTTMAHALYELAQNQPIQDRLRKEIREQLQKDNGVLTYDGIKKMKYLNMVFREALRKYPPAIIILRRCVVDYTFEGTDITIPKGTKVFMPVYTIQRDPKYYPEPDVFDPERFSDEMIESRHPMAYLPFGDGPRNCIGARFADNQSKIGLITVLRDYKVEVCEKTVIPYVVDPKSFLLAPKGGVYLKVTKVS